MVGEPLTNSTQADSVNLGILDIKRQYIDLR